MDFTDYTPIYVRVGGSDTNDGLTVETPKLTAQSAYDAAFAAEGNCVIDLGANSESVPNFGGVVLAADWPSRIGIRGVSVTQSILGGISGNGTDEDGETPASSGFNITICGNNTCNLGNISANGGYGRIGGFGGAITLTNSTCDGISTIGGDADGAGDGGTVTLTNSTCDNIATNGGYGRGAGGAGGTVTLTDSTCDGISTIGGDADGAGNGSTVTLTDSIFSDIVTNGGYGGSAESDYGGNGGAVILLRSTWEPNFNGYSSSNQISTEGGYSDTSSGTTGSITMTACIVKARRELFVGGSIHILSSTDILGTGLL